MSTNNDEVLEKNEILCSNIY